VEAFRRIIQSRKSVIIIYTLFVSSFFSIQNFFEMKTTTTTTKKDPAPAFHNKSGRLRTDQWKSKVLCNNAFVFMSTFFTENRIIYTI